MLLYSGRPEYLFLQGTLDEEGGFVATKQNFSQYEINVSDEVALTNLSLRHAQMVNILDGEIVLLPFNGYSTPKTPLPLPKSRITTLGNLFQKLRAVTFSNLDNHKWVFNTILNESNLASLCPSNSESGEILFPSSVYYCLGMSNREGSLDEFFKAFMSFLNPEGAIMATQKTLDGNNYLSLKVDSSISPADMSNVKGAPVCRPMTEEIWGLISHNASAYILVHSDFIKESFIGRERTRTLDIFPYDPKAHGAEWWNKVPENLQWKWVSKTNPTHLFFSVATSTDRPLSHTDFLVQLKLRKKNLF